MSAILNNSFKEGQLPVRSGFYLSTRTMGVIYFPCIDFKEMHSKPRQHGWNNDICFVGIRMSPQDKEINRSVDSGRQRQHSLLSASRRSGCSVCIGKPARRIRVSWIGSDRFSVNWLSLSGFLPLTPLSALLRGMGGCWKERTGREGAEMVKGSARLAWQPICIYFWLPLEMNRCGRGLVQPELQL